MSQISQSYSGADATLEIIIMLGVMLILGYILGRLTAPKYQKISQAEIPSAIKAVPAQKSQNVKTSVKKARSDDLSVIEGIGPKTLKHLEKHGVKSFQDILNQDVVGLEKILSEGGVGIKGTSPATWPDQARLAMKEKWTELEEYQSILNGKRKNLVK